MAGGVRSEMTEAEYLAYDASHDGKYEFVNGEMIVLRESSDLQGSETSAMAGATLAHALLTANAQAGLRSRLRGRPCLALGSDLRVRIDETGLYAYPDVSVSCEPREFAPTNPPTLLNPTVIVEVIAPSTVVNDLGVKFEHYRRRASIQTVLLVDSRARAVTRYSRNANGTWTLEDHVDGDVPVVGLDVTLTMDELYEGWTPELAAPPVAPG